jgi:prophage DNA circulation protein
MDTPTFTDDRPFAAVESALEAEIKNLVALAKHVSSPSLAPQIEDNFVRQASSPTLAPQIEDNFVRQASSPTLAPQIENNAGRIMSSVARLTSNSIQELEGLKSELQKLQEFLSSEVGRVQQEIESALAGITIIVETIAPWKNMASVTPPIIARTVRARPPTNVEATQSRDGERGSFAASPSSNRT